jgi:hypothetical protein
MVTVRHLHEQLTSALGPIKTDPSKPPAISLTCFGRPTLQHTPC